MTTIAVAHRTASGSLAECWEYDREAKRVTVSMRQGSAYLSFAVFVCSPAAPRVGAHPLLRRDSESWRILPVRFVVEWPEGFETLRPMDCPVSNSLAHGITIELRNTPPEVDALLEGL